MRMPHGRHQGKSVVQIVLQDPGYTMWMIDESEPSGWLRRAADEAEELIRVFDRKRIRARCDGSGCKRRAARMLVYPRDLEVTLWCRECDPRYERDLPGHFTFISAYIGCADYARLACGWRDGDAAIRKLVGVLAEAKGAPGRITEYTAAKFFGLALPMIPIPPE